MSKKKELNTEIGNRIRISREQAGWTQERLAESINRSPQFISTIERGSAGASLETVVKICEVLSVTSDWLLRGVERTATADRIAKRLSELTSEQLAIIDRLATDILTLVQITAKE